MGDILEILFSNFLVVAAVIGGIFSFFSGLNKKKQEKGSRKPSSSVPTGPAASPEPAIKEVSEQRDENIPDSQTRTRNYYDEKQKRQEELQEYQKNRGQDLTSSTQTGIGAPYGPDGIQVDYGTQKKNAIRYSRHWNQQRLADGIIMSEILGPPRAYKPHRSNPRKR
ncbi:hypothetical protein [Halobacillus naozhouensis]|uniref:Uncharacterized protein n=1 Tax=Halobacillus naozhouensis TaxID=554880 RepID=A0ABY8IVF8_9BACI|nr:hypothetical protein [Halobacillus naozhouensis]WFT73294.1 hypothetical protein P9989_12910 [Halobacillus naozhouensis]